MKRKLILAFVVVLSFTGGAVSYAAAKAVNGLYDGFPIVKVFSGGKELVPSGVPAIVHKGTTLVPIALLRQLGVDVKWDQATYSVDVKVPKKYPLSPTVIETVAEKTTALIYALDETGTAREQGSGFVVSEDGLLLTADHVVQEGGKYRDLKILLNGQIYLVGKENIIYKDAEKDICLIQLPAGRYEYVSFNPDEPKGGDTVYAAGFPNGKWSVVKGEISTGFDGDIVVRIYVEPGMSGGVLLNEYGEAIGVMQRGGYPDIRIGGAIGGEQVYRLIQ